MSIPIKVFKISNMVMVEIFFLWFGRDFFYILSHPQEDPSFKGVPDDILHDY